MNQLEHERLREFLGHIIEACDRTREYVENDELATFLNDHKTQDAVIRNIEIIGEAANNVFVKFPEYASQHSDVPWRDAYLMRNRLSHGYFSVDLELVWKTVKSDLPVLKALVRVLLDDLTTSR